MAVLLFPAFLSLPTLVKRSRLDSMNGFPRHNSAPEREERRRDESLSLEDTSRKLLKRAL
jgi:hypothetical protein